MDAFKSLSITGWRQFESIDLNFDSRLTILTGANGAGKTTILNILTRFLGWDLQVVAGRRRKGDSFRNLVADAWNDERISIKPMPQNGIRIGSLALASGQESEIYLNSTEAAIYRLQFTRRQLFPGIFISSHRPEYFYTPVKDVPTTLSPINQLIEQYITVLKQRYSAPTLKAISPLLSLKRSLYSLAIFGFGNQVITPDATAYDAFSGFENILRQILPDSLGFTKLAIDKLDILLVTASGTFPIDGVSGGIASMIDIAWQLFLRSQISERFTVVIDEPETHLHPELQRQILPRLLNAFPTAQFIVATHNPFVVVSYEYASVYVLDYNANNKVVSRSLEIQARDSRVGEVLRNVLGVSELSPTWVEKRIEEIMRRFSNEPVTPDLLDKLKLNLVQMGLANSVAELVARFVGGKSRDSIN